MHKHIVPYKVICVCAILYLYLPFLVFCIGWINIFLAVVTIITTGLSITFFITKNIHNENNYFFSIKEVLLYYIFFILLFIFLGQGDLFPQDFDWNKHHAVYNDLLQYSWPVVYSDGSMLTYYLGQYIVPVSIVKKIFNHSNDVLRIIIPAWNALGILLAYLITVHYLKCSSVREKILVVIFFVFFGGGTNLGQSIFRMMGHEGISTFLDGNYKWIYPDVVRVHFASNYDALFGAYQHVIVPWICCALFLYFKDAYETYGIIVLPLFFSSTFGFVYIVVFLFIYILYVMYVNKDRKKILKEIFSFRNLLLIPLVLIIFIYLLGNVLVEKPTELGVHFYNVFEHLDFFIIFWLVEFLGYAIIIWKYNRKNVLLYISIITLIISSIISMGAWNDLCSRGSIPARFILMILCIEHIEKVNINDWRNIFLAIFLSFAFFNTGVQISRQMDTALTKWDDKAYYLKDEYGSLDGFFGNANIRPDNAYNYYTPNYKKSLFFHISRHKE